MNRRKDEPRTSVSVFIAVILAATFVAAGGVLYAFFKNRQIQVSREIDAVDRRIEHARLDIRTTEMRMDELLNRFTIRKQLEDNHSTLRPIAFSVVEEIKSTPPARRSVAAADR